MILWARNFSLKKIGVVIFIWIFSVAVARASADVKRAASEQAGVLIETVSEIQNGQLTRDEIRTVSSVVLKINKEVITVENFSDSIMQYRCHIIAVVDNSNLTKKTKTLKEKFKTASEPEKQKINVQVKRNETKFTAAQYYEITVLMLLAALSISLPKRALKMKLPSI